MTRGELKRERAMEKARARIVKAELARMKRQEQIKEKAEDIFSVMTAIALLGLLILAFVIDALSAEAIPFWVYAIGFAYMTTYAVFAYNKYFK